MRWVSQHTEVIEQQPLQRITIYAENDTHKDIGRDKQPGRRIFAISDTEPREGIQA